LPAQRCRTRSEVIACSQSIARAVSETHLKISQNQSHAWQ
jgi:hypothetical protein